MTYDMHILVKTMKRIEYATYTVDMVALECQHFLHFLNSMLRK